MSRLTSILQMKCPRCRRGNLFSKTNLYVFKDSLKMPDRCPVCGQDFKMEPGFYIGALWTSFPIVIALITVFSIFFLAYLELDINVFFVVITILLFALQPLIIRLGRVIWINVFVRYDPKFKDQ